VVSPPALVASVAELVAMAKAYPRELIYASAGCDTPSHLASALFLHHAAMQVGHLAYKGAPAALVPVMDQLVDFAFAGVATALPLIKAGKLRALATAGTQRLPALPDVPTLTELGFDGVQLNEWYAIAAPAGTAADIVAELARELTRAVNRPDVAAR